MFHDSAAPPSVAIEAFTTTAAALYDWCAPGDVDAALETMNRPLTDLGGFVRHTDARN